VLILGICEVRAVEEKRAAAVALVTGGFARVQWAFYNKHL
jgi:hypothetical protein